MAAMRKQKLKLKSIFRRPLFFTFFSKCLMRTHNTNICAFAVSSI